MPEQARRVKTLSMRHERLLSAAIDTGPASPRGADAFLFRF